MTDRAGGADATLDGVIGGFGTALCGRLDDFWDAWGGLALDPASLPARAALLAVAREIATTVRQFGAALRRMPDEAVRPYRAALDAVVAALSGTVNSAQARGFDLAGLRGAAVFAGTTADDFTVALAEPSGVAAARVAGSTLHNENADALSQAALHPGSADAVVVALVATVATGSAAAAMRRRIADAAVSYADRLAAPGPRPADAPARAAAGQLLAAVDGLLEPLRAHTGYPAATAGHSAAAARSADSQLTVLQQRLSTGRRISRPADDPDGVVTALGLHSARRRSARYAAACDDAWERLSVVETACAQLLTVLHRARTAGATAQLAALLTWANATHRGRPVFGGATTGRVAYDSAGSYVGDANPVLRTVAPHVTVDVSVSGPEVFGSYLADLREYGPRVSLAPLVDNVQAARNAADEARRRVRRANTVRQTSEALFAQRLRALEEVDVAEVVARVAQAEIAYRSAAEGHIGAARQSLRDFLR